MVARDQYLTNIEPFIDKPIIKVITGMRRVGKSTFIHQLINNFLENGIDKSRIIYINKESLEFDFLQNYTDLNNFILTQTQNSKDKFYLFIDEVQEIEQWEKAILSFFNQNNMDIYVTGSNAHLFSTELATLLSGRYITFQIFPLTFNEFLDFRKININSIDLEKEFNNFLKFGGLPGIHLLDLDDTNIFQYINSIFSTILLKDVTKRYNIRDVAQLERITKFIFDNCGNIISAKKISDYLKSQNSKITVDTVQNFLNYLQSAFLIYKTQRYDIKGKKHLEFLEKYYMGDIGIRHGFIGYRDNDISGILENVVYLELLNRGYTVTIGKYNKLEIDFVAEQNNQVEYFQVSYLLASEDTIDREFLPLEKLTDNFPKTVLSLDKHQMINRNGINHINLIDWLLK